MSTTINDIFQITMDLMDERLENGELSTDDTIEYKRKTPGLLNQLQAEILKNADYYKSYDLSFYPMQTLMGSFDVKEHSSEDVNEECAGSTKAYYFEVDNDSTVYIEDYTGVWNTLKTISATSTNGFTAYKGIVTPTAGATQSRIRFSGSYYYRYRNYALYEQPFASDSDVPVYKANVPYTMPSDFRELVEIIKEYPQRSYDVSGNFKWENNLTLLVDYNYKGSIRINYRPKPTTLTYDDSLSGVLVVDDVVATTVLPYALAARLLIHEDLTKADYYEQKYQEALFIVMKPKPAQFDDIEDIYGGFYG